jgi:hypothetical protein
MMGRTFSTECRWRPPLAVARSHSVGMTKLRALQRPVSSLLDEFIEEISAPVKPVTARRIAEVRVHLENYLDEYGDDIVEDRDAFLAERARDPVGVFGRVGNAEDLFCAFYGYVSPEFRLPTPVDARCQVRLVGDLAQWMWSRGLLPRLNSNSCIVLDVEYALRRARRDVAAAGARK